MVVLTLVPDLHHPVSEREFRKKEKKDNLKPTAPHLLVMEFFESLLAIPGNSKLCFQRIKFVREVIMVRFIVLDIRV